VLVIYNIQSWRLSSFLAIVTLQKIISKLRFKIHLFVSLKHMFGLFNLLEHGSVRLEHGSVRLEHGSVRLEYGSVRLEQGLVSCNLALTLQL